MLRRLLWTMQCSPQPCRARPVRCSTHVFSSIFSLGRALPPPLLASAPRPQASASAVSSQPACFGGTRPLHGLSGWTTAGKGTWRVTRNGLCHGLPSKAATSLSPECRFPFAEPLTLPTGEQVSSAVVLEKLSQFVEPQRLARIEQVVANRTFNVLPIVEGVYDMGNLAAVLRSADAMGIGHMHVINTSDGAFKQSARPSAGAEKWLHVKTWTTATDCLAAAKASGYQVVVTHLRANAVAAEDVDWSRPTAVVFGNERAGVSQAVLDAADQCAIIPMVGMVESLNISVAAAMMLNEARRGRLARLGYHGDLTEEQQATLRAVMLLRNKRGSDDVLHSLLNREAPGWQEHKRWHRELVRNRQNAEA